MARLEIKQKCETYTVMLCEMHVKIMVSNVLEAFRANFSHICNQNLVDTKLGSFK